MGCKIFINETTKWKLLSLRCCYLADMKAIPVLKGKSLAFYVTAQDKI